MAIDYKEFVSKERSMLIAPAGHGKTYTIAESLKHAEGKQLILTHTHAGIASLKEKIKSMGIPSKNYHIETIASYAQKYVLGFYKGGDIPNQDNSAAYYPFIIKKAEELIKRQPIERVVKLTYTGVIVDEYQDCNSLQHSFIMALADILPTSILGDPLQGIFAFKGDVLVDLTSQKDMGDFLNYSYELTEPKRWEGINPGLGQSLKAIRHSILAREHLDLTKHKTIELYIHPENDIYNPSKKYYKDLIRLIKSEENLLVIHPNSTAVAPRKRIVSLYSNILTLIEAIDDKDFYEISRSLDDCNPAQIHKQLRDIAYTLFNSTGLDVWFNEQGVKDKRKPIEKAMVESLNNLLIQYSANPSLGSILELLKVIKNLPGIVCYRRELLWSILKAVENASHNSTSVYQGMVDHRNKTRRHGRQIKGKCIGTTLLTKGLEFDTVVVLNAHKFDCPKHLYVALTRARNRLIVFTQNKTLSPY